MQIKIQFTDGSGALGLHQHMPTYATPGSAGLDLVAAIKAPIILMPGDVHLIPAGFKIELPPNTEAQVRPRSGLALKHGITVLNSPGTIDSDYRGEVGVILINHGSEPFEISPLMRVAQMVIATVIRAKFVQDLLDETSRGVGGFGSTGVEVRTGSDQKVVDVFYDKATLEQLEQAGFNGSKASETIRAILTKLTERHVRLALDSIGVYTHDRDAKIYSLETIIKRIDQAFVSMGANMAQRNEWIEKHFGATLAPQIFAMMKVF